MEVDNTFDNLLNLNAESSEKGGKPEGIVPTRYFCFSSGLQNEKLHPAGSGMGSGGMGRLERGEGWGTG